MDVSFFGRLFPITIESVWFGVIEIFPATVKAVWNTAGGEGFVALFSLYWSYRYVQL